MVQKYINNFNTLFLNKEYKIKDILCSFVVAADSYKCDIILRSVYRASKYSSHMTTEPNTKPQNGNMNDTIR